MDIHCPFCSFHIVVKGAAPGGYQPTCQKCQRQFVFLVPRGDKPGPPLVAKTLDELRALGAAATATATATKRNLKAAPPPRRAALVTSAAELPTQSGVAPPAPQHDGDLAQRTMTQPGREPPAPPPDADTSANGDDHALPASRLDGYELIRLIGRGGMGRVYLARQLSLDRLVAVKTIDPQWASDPAFLARFVREAYAVAQLSHHHIVQIHDIGEEENTHFFSMEYVEGQSLTDLVRAHGQLDPEAAATYILHAARGLKFAHDHHMVHRDVKPSNLLLNDLGLVKVADLGLVKTPQGKEHGKPREPLTRAAAAKADTSDPTTTSPAFAIGTPAYMSPEQARDAAGVDERADIYALGATFYHLVTGRPPFVGDSVEALLKQHAEAPLPPPEQFAPRLPKSLSLVIQRMLAKDPAERYQKMDELIAALESHLGIEAGPFTPRSEHAVALEQAVSDFNTAPSVRLRTGLITLFLALLAAAVGVGLWREDHLLIGAAVGLGAFTAVSYQLLSGLVHRSVLMRRLRQYVFASDLRQWAMALGVLAAVVAIVVLLGLQWLYLGMIAAGVALAALFFFSVDLWVRKQQRPHVEAVRQMLKEMRLRGLEEEALRRFVCRYSGRRWEPFYEALFGYEAKMQARRHWGDDLDGRPRPRYGRWRDSLIEWLEVHQRDREEARHRRHLQRLEQRRLRAEGVSDSEAILQAAQSTRDLIHRAEEYRRTGKRSLMAEALYHRRFEDAEDDDIPDSWKLVPRTRTERWTTLLLGARGRFAAGAVLLYAWALWVSQHRLLPVFVEDRGTWWNLRLYLRQKPPAIDLPGIPDAVLNALCSHGAALAGALLVASTLARGRKMTLFMLPAVIVLLRAPFLPLRGEGMLTPYEWTLLGGVGLGMLGLYYGRIRYD